MKKIILVLFVCSLMYSTGFAAQQLLINGESGLAARTKINENTTELYGPKDADEVELSEVGTATYDDVQDWNNTTQSAGIISGCVIADDGDGTITVSAGTGIIKSANTEVAANLFFNLAENTTLSLTDESMNYIAIDYNSGSPQLIVGTTNTANGHTIFNIGKVFKEGTTIDLLNSGLRVQDFSKRVQQNSILRVKQEFVSGARVSETGTMNIGITAGVLLSGENSVTTDAVDTSGAPTFEYYYYDGDAGPAAWVESSQSAIDSANYNNTATGLSTIAANRYGVHWVYKGGHTHTYVLYGQGSYTLAAAQAVQPPTSLPIHVSEMGVLRAKIITYKDDVVFTEIQNVSDTAFTYSTASNHNELGGLDGGEATYYGHVTSAEKTVLGNTSGTNSGDNAANSTYTIGSATQAWDTDLDTYAGITPSANVQSFLGAATYAAMLELLNLEAGTDFYSTSATDTLISAKEDSLGNPGTNDYVLASQTDGTRSWVAPGGSGTPEGTAVLSTGVTEGYVLQADGDNSSSWVALGAGHTQGTDTALGTLGTKSLPIDADKMVYRDSTAADALVTMTFTEAKAFLKTYNDTLYNPLNTVTAWNAIGDATAPGTVDLGVHAQLLQLGTAGSLKIGTSLVYFEFVEIAGVQTLRMIDNGTPSNIAINLPSDSINDLMIDWGTGANQISHDDIPDGSTYVRTQNDLTDTLAGNIATNNDKVSATESTVEGFVFDADNTGALYTTGLVQGGVYTATYSTAQTLTAAQCYNSIIYVTGTCTITLPAIAAGMNLCIIADGTATVTIDPNGSEVLRRDGTAQTGGVTLVSPGVAGDMAVLTYHSSGVWYAATNTWVVGT